MEIAAIEKLYDDGAGKRYLRPWVVDLAFKVQKELEDGLVHLAGLLLEKTGHKRLCLAGGVALNSVANYALLTRLSLEDIFIFPAAGDAGVAAGCAWWAYRTAEAGQDRHRLLHASLGRPYSMTAVREAIQRFDGRIQVEEVAPVEMVHRTSQMLARGQIIARFDGRSEYGPRALGQRSILADPTFARMKEILNERIKFREAFRPFAPAVPQEAVPEIFERSTTSPFMLLVPTIRDEYREVLPAVTHVDGTGRLQTVTESQNPFLHSVCHALRQLRPGPPVLLNTSFNVAGQPIVETPEDAIETFLTTDIDALALEGFWIRKSGVPVLGYDEHLAKVKDGPLPRGSSFDIPDLTPVMKELDRALFAGAPSDFTREELDRLGSEGARFKETSILFPDLGPLPRIHTRLSDSAVLLLDGSGRARLCDLADRRAPRTLSQDDALLLLALHSRAGRALEEQRRRMGLTTAQHRERTRWLRDEAMVFGLDIPPLDQEQAAPTLTATGAETEIFPRLDGRDPETRATLDRLRQLLRAERYTAAEICHLLAVPSQQQLLPTHLHYWSKYRLPSTPLADLIRLFHLRQAVDEHRLRAILGADVVSFLRRQNLLVPRGAALASRVDLFELEGLFIATDHRFSVLDEDRITEEPVMYLGMDSTGLVHVTPQDPAGRTLDLCCGSGVQGLLASRWCGQVVGVDLNPRAIRFSVFNALLNGIENIRFVCSDLYTQVDGERFDVILANPPFVPSPVAGCHFRDGGRDGESVLRPIVERSTEFLAPDGLLCAVSDLVDLPNYEVKLRRWWSGGRGAALVLSTADRDEALFSVPHCHAPFDQSFEAYNAALDRWVDNFRDAQIETVNFGYLILRRSAHARALEYSTRTIHNPTRSMSEDVRRHFRQQAALQSSGLDDTVVRVHPSIRIREEMTIDGHERRLELVGDEYFSTYGVTDSVRELLRVASSGSSWSKLKAMAPEPVLRDLVNKGILLLENVSALEPRKDKKAPPPMQQAKTTQTPPDEWSVHERATKTTPTCLTSYLHQPTAR